MRLWFVECWSGLGLDPSGSLPDSDRIWSAIDSDQRDEKIPSFLFRKSVYRYLSHNVHASSHSVHASILCQHSFLSAQQRKERFDSEKSAVTHGNYGRGTCTSQGLNRIGPLNVRFWIWRSEWTKWTIKLRIPAKTDYRPAVRLVKIQSTYGSIRIDPDHNGYGWGSDPLRVDPDQALIHPDSGWGSDPIRWWSGSTKVKLSGFVFQKYGYPPQFKRHRLIKRTISKLKVQVSQFWSSESQPKLIVELQSTTCNAFYRCI